MQKPLIFLSHIATEKEIAISLKELIEATFMGMIDVFVSSDPNSMAMGGRWLDEITYGLKHCVIEIVLASPKSVKQPWINFETGAGWGQRHSCYSSLPFGNDSPKPSSTS